MTLTINEHAHGDDHSHEVRSIPVVLDPLVVLREALLRIVDALEHMTTAMERGFDDMEAKLDEIHTSVKR